MPGLTIDDRLLVSHFAKRHRLSVVEARRALTELGAADAEALAAGKVLKSYLDGSRTLSELMPSRNEKAG